MLLPGANGLPSNARDPNGTDRLFNIQGVRLRRAITVAPMVHRSPLRCADRATKPCSYQPMAVDSEGRFWAAFYFDRSGFVRLGLRSCLDRPGVRLGGRLTFL